MMESKRSALGIIIFLVSQVYAEDVLKNCSEIKLNGAVRNLTTFKASTESDIRVVWIGANQTTAIIMTLNNKRLPSYIFQWNEKFELVNNTDKLNLCTILESFVIDDDTGDEVVFLLLDKRSNSSSLVPEQLSMLILDHGTNFTIPKPLPFRVRGPIYVNPWKPWLLLLLGEKCSDSPNYQAFSSEDYGQTWNDIMFNVTEVHWDPVPPKNDNEILIYLLVNTSGISNESKLGFDLIRTTLSRNRTLTVIAQNVTSLNIQDKFIYAEFYLSDSKLSSQLKVSTSKGRVWNNVQYVDNRVCNSTKKRFNASQGITFLHCGDKGSLYVSDADGLIFTLSLTNQVTGNFFNITSKKGSYITEQSAGNSIFSMVTFDQGLIWKKIICNKPEFCFVGDDTSGKGLLLRNLVTTKSPSDLPVIVGNGYESDVMKYLGVYLSNDGAYTWMRIFPDKRLFYLSMHGSLIITSSDSPDLSQLNYSSSGVDAWYCQSLFNTGTQIVKTLTGPNSQNSSLVLVVSYEGLTENTFTATLVDFDYLINKTCVSDDLLTVQYPVNVSHSECNLGFKETLLHMNQNSSCLLRNMDLLRRNLTSCNCTRNDYECDFGFQKTLNDSKPECLINHDLDHSALDICFGQDPMTIETTGYRKAVNNYCNFGWKPENYSRVRHLHLHCFNEDENPDDNERLRNAMIGVITMLVLVALLSMMVFFLHKLQLLRRQTPTYRYSMLNQDENPGQSSSDDANETLVDISSDDEGSPAKLLVESQTVFASTASNSTSNGYIPETQLRPIHDNNKAKSILEDTDDVSFYFTVKYF